METRVYDAEMNFIGVSENQTSFIWTRRYFEPGEFIITLPLTKENMNIYQMGRLVSVKGAKEAGVIENIEMRENATERTLTASGRFLSSYMDRRLIRPRINFSGFTEVAMRTVLSNAVPIPKVELGELQGFTETVRFQATYRNLLEYEEKLGLSAGIGFRFRPDFEAGKIYFECYKGLDKTRHQTDRAFVEFSDKFDNLNEAYRRVNDQLLKNVGYVGGEGEGTERVFVVVGNDSLTGLARREVYIDARDLTSEDLTSAEYVEVLRRRGEDKLAEDVFSDSFECSTIAVGNYTYRKDYDLGDIVTVRKTDWNVSVDLRITELSEVYEQGVAVVAPTFGTPLPTKIDWEEY